MADRHLLKMLIDKYGKDIVLEQVNEAFNSDVMRKFDAGIRRKNAQVKDDAIKQRHDKMGRLYKKHFDSSRDDMDMRFDHDLGCYGEPGDNSRENYEKNAQYIQRDFESYIRNNSVDSLNTILKGFGFYDIDWHNITNDDFIEVPKNKVRKYTRGAEWDNYIVFWVDDNDEIFAVSRGTDVKYTKRALRREGRRSFDATKVIDLIDAPNVEKTLVLTNLSKFRNERVNKSVARHDARKGVVERTDAYNEEVRKLNLARYKRIIAQNNVNKFDAVDNDVRGAVRRLADYCLMDDCDFSVVRNANKLIDEILSSYEKFCDNRATVKKGDSTYDGYARHFASYGTTDYYNREMKNFANMISDKIAKLNTLLG